MGKDTDSVAGESGPDDSQSFHHSRPMTRQFEEIDFQKTRIGELSLRRKKVLSLGGKIVYEVKINEGFLMSSLFTAAEEAVADLGLAQLGEGPLDVVVGGLGLGYTAAAALKNPAVRSMIIIEAVEPVIEWHRRGFVPLGDKLNGDARCRFLLADFFALAENPDEGFDPVRPGRQFHAVLLDIDHTPNLLLHESHAAFYQPAGLRQLAAHLYPGGVFAMWSDGETDGEFLAALQSVFSQAEARRVTFYNPLQDRDAASTVYVARKETEPDPDGGSTVRSPAGK